MRYLYTDQLVLFLIPARSIYEAERSQQQQNK